MFKEGALLYFDPFLFKNGASPKRKYFIVLHRTDDDILLASLPTSKDHIPSDEEIRYGCLESPERRISVFVFIARQAVATNGFAFPRNTFVYGADLDEYRADVFLNQQETNKTQIIQMGILQPTVFADLKRCLSESKMVKNRYRRLLTE